MCVRLVSLQEDILPWQPDVKLVVHCLICDDRRYDKPAMVCTGNAVLLVGPWTQLHHTVTVPACRGRSLQLGTTLFTLWSLQGKIFLAQNNSLTWNP